MKKVKTIDKFGFYLLAVIFVVSTLIKLFYIWENNLAFTPDQGRDLIDIRQMVVLHAPRLVGPTTSINGVLLGPFYYYFIAIPFVLFGGSPFAIVVWQIFWFQISALYAWFVIRKKNFTLANLTAILLLLSPIGFYTGRYFWNANVMPIFTMIYFTCLLDTLWFKNSTNLIVLGLVSGLSLQIEAAFGLLFFPFALLVGFSRKFSLRDLLRLGGAFAVTLLPQLLFEFRHGFLMTKTLLAGLSGASPDLGEKITFTIKIVERYQTFLTAFRQSNHLGFEYLGPVFLLAILSELYFLINYRKTRPGNFLVYLSLGFMFVTAVFYLIFPQHLKNWYTFGLSIPAVFFLSGFLINLFHENLIGRILVWAFIFFSFYRTLLAHTGYLAEYLAVPSSDPSNLATQLKAVDWVYQEAGGQAFRVYNYLPSVYDHTYQYLFWWYGTQKYGYQPADIAYLPDQPEYIANNRSFWQMKKEIDLHGPTFLIIQGDGDHQDRLDAWRERFNSLCQIKSFPVTQSLTLSKLETCSKNTIPAR